MDDCDRFIEEQQRYSHILEQVQLLQAALEEAVREPAAGRQGQRQAEPRDSMGSHAEEGSSSPAKRSSRQDWLQARSITMPHNNSGRWSLPAAVAAAAAALGLTSARWEILTSHTHQC